VELQRDVSLRIAPLTDHDAEEMVREIRGHPLLAGYRGRPGVNIEAVHDLLHRVSRLATDLPEIRELDLNPVLAFEGNKPCVALDARLRVESPAGEAAARPAAAAAG
jgi:acyl-CoA synthetase (NDP forming)